MSCQRKSLFCFLLVSLVTSCFILIFNSPPVSAKFSPGVFTTCLLLSTCCLGCISSAFTFALAELGWRASFFFLLFIPLFDFVLHFFPLEVIGFVLSSFHYFFLSQNEWFLVRTLAYKKKTKTKKFIVRLPGQCIILFFLSGGLPRDKAEINSTKCNSAVGVFIWPDPCRRSSNNRLTRRSSAAALTFY